MYPSTQPSFPSAHHALDELQLRRLTQAVQGLSREQVHWASGFLAGLSQRQQPLEQAAPAMTVTVLYASHTGNGRGIAEQLARDGEAAGLDSRVVSVADYKPRDLGKERVLILVVSTHGEGDVPETALELERFLFGKRAPRLDQLQYSVFALGDSSYEQFCAAGRRLDERLQELGAKRLLQRVDADVDYSAVARDWSGEVLQKAREVLPEQSASVATLPTAAKAVGVDRNNPYRATIIDQRRITTDDAIANVHHIALEIDPQRVRYRPGDALGVWAQNDPEQVNGILAALVLDGGQRITIDGESMSLFAALRDKLELTLLHPGVVARWADLCDSTVLQSLTGDARQLREFARDRQLIDLVTEFPAPVNADVLVTTLHPLQPRLYSIASSQAVSADEVHLTVSAVQYHAHGRDHAGTASNHLIQRLQEGDEVGIYVAENTQFRLPVDNAAPVVLIGAGTGIAPYRAFLQQRQADGAQGPNWLVFGNRHFKRDFLYQQDWINLRQAGYIDRVNVAFSRDSGQRCYVQDRLLEQGKDLWQWIQRGAHLYVCGGIDMERAVRQTLIHIVHHFGGMNASAAETLIDNLRAEGRYQRDVY